MMKRFFIASLVFLRTHVVDLVIVAIIVGAICAIIALQGCGRSTPAIVPTTKIEVAPDTKKETTEAEQAHDDVAELKGKLKAAQERADLADAREREARLAGIRTMITWLTAICVVVGILSVGAFVFWRMKSLILLTGACGAMVVAAQSTNILLDHPYIAGACLLLVVLLALLVVWLKERKNMRGLVSAVSFGHDMSNCDEDDKAEALKEIHEYEQKKLGVHDLISKALVKVRKAG